MPRPEQSGIVSLLGIERCEGNQLAKEKSQRHRAALARSKLDFDTVIFARSSEAVHVSAEQRASVEPVWQPVSGLRQVSPLA